MDCSTPKRIATTFVIRHLRYLMLLIMLSIDCTADTSWTNLLGFSGGSGGPTSGIHFVTIAGQPARMVIGQGYQHAKPTFLAFYLHSDGGEYGTTEHDSFIMTNGWVYISPRCPPGTGNTNMFTWDARFGGSQAANVAQIKAALEYMITNFNVYTNFYFGAGASGGSWFYDYYGTSFTSYPSYFILNCGASQRTSAQTPSTYVRANSEFMYAIGTGDFLYPNALTSVPAYTNAGYSVLTDYMLGVGHCGFTTRTKTTNYWAGVIRRKSGVCDLYLRPNVLQLPSASSTQSVAVINGSNCVWSLSTTNSWISFLSGTTGSANGSVQFRVQVNTSEQSRIGNILTGGKSLLIEQRRSDDPYEPNNTQAAAFDVTAARGQWLSEWQGSGILCDNDIYRFQIEEPNSLIQAEITFTNSQGDLDLNLLSGSWNTLTSSVSVSNREYVEFIAPSAGTYYLSVFLYGGGGGGNCQVYNLRWNAVLPPSVAIANVSWLDGNMFTMSIDTLTGRVYTMQHTDWLMNPNWSNLPGYYRVPGLGTSQHFSVYGQASNQYFRFFHEAP